MINCVPQTVSQEALPPLVFLRRLSATRKATNIHLRTDLQLLGASKQSAGSFCLPTVQTTKGRTRAAPSILSGSTIQGYIKTGLAFPRPLKYHPVAGAGSFLASCLPVHPCLSLISGTQLGKSSFETHGSVEVCEAHAIFLLICLSY